MRNGGWLGTIRPPQSSGGIITPNTLWPGTGGGGTVIPAAIHFWPMTDGGTTFADHIGTTNLTASNVTYAVTSGLGATAVAQFAAASKAIASVVDATLNFNGTQPMSVSFWINPSAPIGGSFCGNLMAPSTYAGWEVSVTGTSEAGFLVVGTVTTNQMTAGSSPANLAIGTPALVTVTYNGNLNVSGVKLYINGVSQTLADSSGTLTSGNTSTQPFIVGERGDGTNQYTGAMAYMRVWNLVLTQAQVTLLNSQGPQ